MLRKTLVIAVLAVLASSPAFAQRIEVGGLFGYTFSEGVPITANVGTTTFTDADPVSSISYGFTFGVFVTPNTEVEFLWVRQDTELQVSGNSAPLRGDMTVDTYHGNFLYHFGDPEAVARPFLLLGIGATDYGDATFTGRTVEGLTRFSWAMGGGVKAYPSTNVGIKAMVRWTPTYIKTDGFGWWCDPYWGCAPVGDAQYSNQFEFSGGVVFRF
jgi:hypothetical protein